MNKYVLVVDEYREIQHYPFISNKDIENLLDELDVLNSMAITEDSSSYSYLNIKLRTVYSRYVTESHNIYTLEDWFKEYCVNWN